MAQIAIPNRLLPIVATCEAAYADASRKGYAKNPDVVAAVAELKSAYKALAVANVNRVTAKGFFAATVAIVRAHRACRAIRGACVKIQTTLEQVSAEDRLYGRFQTLFGSTCPEIKITDCDEAKAARATNPSSQTQSTSAPDTARVSNEPKTEVASARISNEAVEEEELSRKLGSAGADAAVRDAYKNLNREDPRLGDEFIRILGLIGKPKNLDRIVTLVRISNTNRPPTRNPGARLGK
jgi:hypothetical protein